MNELKMKAKAGVTLVELLVVILIVTILSVSMLPLLQPFVTEAQYAAEAIPVIGNLRTKIGLYQYDRGAIPSPSNNTYVVTWKTGIAVAEDTGVLSDTSDKELFGPAYYVIPSDASRANIVKDDNPAAHLQQVIDIDYQDLKGKRSKPTHYQYYPIHTGNQSYVLACFGDGNGLKAGTGYAVCEMNFKNKKYIGTWKRYKAVDESKGALQFATTQVDPGVKVDYCYVPAAADYDPSKYDDKEGKPQVILDMETAGWEF